MSGPESLLWARLDRAWRPFRDAGALDYQRVENGLRGATPDLDIACADWDPPQRWIELKVARAAKRAERAERAERVSIKWRPGQVAWLRRRDAAVPGSALLLLGVPSGELLILTVEGVDAVPGLSLGRVVDAAGLTRAARARSHDPVELLRLMAEVRT